MQQVISLSWPQTEAQRTEMLNKASVIFNVANIHLYFARIHSVVGSLHFIAVYTLANTLYYRSRHSTYTKSIKHRVR